MIEFKNGKCLGGDLSKVVVSWSGQKEKSYGDYELNDSAHALVIYEGTREIDFYNLKASGIKRLPEHVGERNEIWKDFWLTHSTYVFESFESGMEFLSSYEGYRQEDVEAYYLERNEMAQREAARIQFECTCNLEQHVDADFMNDLTEFIYEHKAPMHMVLGSMKLYMLDFYKRMIEEEGWA